jgi:hypothetical protein
MPMFLCPSCSTHIRADEPRCPFCHATRSRRVDLATIAAALISLLSIAACAYGLPPKHDAGVDSPPPTDAHNDAH